MSLLSVVLPFVCVVSARLAVGIAPGDEDPLCDILRTSGSSRLALLNYERGQSILMDSWNYEFLLDRDEAVWDTVDYDTNNANATIDRWRQLTNTPCLGTVTVCGFRFEPQSNWLITQLISRTVNGVHLPQVKVLIEFELQTCTDLRCQRTFSVYIYETSEDANRRDISRYRQIERVSANNIDGTLVNETVTVNFNTSNSSFYLAIRDETTCIIISRLIVFYGICPRQLQDKVVFPETIAPVVGASPVPINAMCIENAEPVGDSRTTLICKGSQDGGRWTVLTTGECRCERGAFLADGECMLCPNGTYFSPNNNNCSVCPANSVSERDGLAQCDCIDGYYRAATGEEDLPCRLPPSRPLNVTIMSSTEDSITLMWYPPRFDGGIRGLKYGLYYQLLGQSDRQRVKYNVVNETIGTIAGLSSGQTYLLFVSSENSITDQIPESQFLSIATSVQASTQSRSATSVQASTVSRPESFSDQVAVAAVVPSLFTVLLLVLLLVIIVVFIYKYKQNKKAVYGSAESTAYYSTVDPHSTSVASRVQLESVTYEEVKWTTNSSDNVSNLEENVAYGVCA